MDNLDLKKFNDACEEFLLGKYILANLKIKGLLNTINNSNQLSDILEVALDKIDFNIAFSQKIIEKWQYWQKARSIGCFSSGFRFI